MGLPHSLIDVDKQLEIIKAKLDLFTKCAFVIYDAVSDNYVPVVAGVPDDIYFSKDETIKMLHLLMDTLEDITVFGSYEDGIDCINAVLIGSDIKDILQQIVENIKEMEDSLANIPKAKPKSTWEVMNTPYSL